MILLSERKRAIVDFQVLNRGIYVVNGNSIIFINKGYAYVDGSLHILKVILDEYENSGVVSAPTTKVDTNTTYCVGSTEPQAK